MVIEAHFYSDNIGFSVCGSQDWIDNGCGGFNQLCFNLRQKWQQQQQLQQQEWNQSLCFDNNLVPSSLKNNNSSSSSSSSNNGESMIHCQTMFSQVEKQRHEIDQFIRSKNERLRLLLQEQRKQQVAVLVKKIEPMATILLKQKDEEIAKARNTTMELQNMLEKLEMENQTWQRLAHENEAMVLSLNKTLEQLRQQQASCCFNSGVDDGESCCEMNRQGMEAKENRGFAGLFVADHEQQEDEERRINMMTMKTMVCKCCNRRSSCVLLLPCRHLCSCKDCEPFLDSSPVCRTLKKSSMEAFIY